MRPNFLLIGAARSGTTSIYHNLAAHPAIFMPDMKEPQFFTSNWDKGFGWYDALFANWSAEPAVGEASMTYTYPEYANVAPLRIAEALPDVRLVYILREPVERAFSHYKYYRYYSHTEQAEFEVAIKERDIYLGTSLYYQWIKRYLAHVPRENLLVLLFEDYTADPMNVLRLIYQHLGVDDAYQPASAEIRTNASFKPRSQTVQDAYLRLSRSTFRKRVEALFPQSLRPRMRNSLRAVLGSSAEMPSLSQEMRAQLASYFEPEIEALESFLDRDLSIWRS